MKIHEREQIVAEARYEISKAITDCLKKHGLTYGEITSILGGEISGLAKSQIREERSSDSSEH